MTHDTRVRLHDVAIVTSWTCIGAGLAFTTVGCMAAAWGALALAVGLVVADWIFNVTLHRP